MAYVSIAEWNPDQVGDWLRGLEDVIQPYIHSFVLAKVAGRKLLHISSSDLIKLEIKCIGHQEIILQAVALLKNLHYHLNQENAQLLALKISSKARSIYNELCASNPPDGCISDINEPYCNNDARKCQQTERVSTKALSGVADVLASVKALVGWLHKSPFSGLEEYDELKLRFVELGIDLATTARRDAFVDKQSSIIRDSCFQLAVIADQIIQESKDPMVLQPACLDVATLKKRAEDTWGISLCSSYHGIHQISVLRALSPAHNSGKLMGGDQIVQVNYQTVIGWTCFKVTNLMHENPVEVVLTIKKCPRHANAHSNIYFSPFRLPSKKRTYSPWATNGFSTNRFDLQSIPNLQFIKSFDGKTAVQRIINTEPHNVSISPPPSNPRTGSAQSLEVSDSDAHMCTQSDVESDLSDDAFITDSELSGAPSSLSVRLFSARPLPHAQRRATIPGTTMRPVIHFDQSVRCTLKEATLPTSSSVGFKAIIQEELKAVDEMESRVDSDTLSSEEMPYIDEQEEKDPSHRAACSAVDRRGFIDKAILPDASPLETSVPVALCNFPPGATGVRRTPVGDRSCLDRYVSSPVYDGHETVNKNISKCSDVDLDSARPLTSFKDKDEGASNQLAVTKYYNKNDDETTIPSMRRSCAEATYVNQNPALDRDNGLGGHFQRRLIRGNRRISCRDLGQGDQQGWLYRRKEHKGFLLPHRWVKRWFILNKSILYGYKDRDSVKADSLIYLPGFHVSPASEVKAKRFAFKIFHSRGGTTFYFACESVEERSRWMSQMGLSAISTTTSRSPPSAPSDEAYYSETDDELDDKHFSKSSSNNRCSSSSHSSKNNSSIATPSTGKFPLSYFSSSKSQPLKFLQSSKAALSNPVPTSNFRTYVRVRDAPNAEQRGVPSSPKVASDSSHLKVKDGSVTLGKEVRRKNSIRERLTNLTMDRRKSSQKPEDASSNPKRICTASKSENSLDLKEGDKASPSIPHSRSVGPIDPDSRLTSTPDNTYSADSSGMEHWGIRGLSPVSVENCPTVLKSDKPCDTSPIQAFSHFKTSPDAIGIKLKCASQYFPVTLGKDRKETMQPAFQMNLSSPPNQQNCDDAPILPKVPRPSPPRECDSPKVRPRVPPRTKFLSPKERCMPTLPDEFGSSISRISRTNQPPNLVISPVSDDGDSPKTPFKPTMGIAMIGKQRKTPTPISPKEILPHYPGMEYPPTFEPESYSLSSQRGIYSQETPTRPTRNSPPDVNNFLDGYININESNEEYKGYCHQIYVTSPFINHDASPVSSVSRQGVSPQSSFYSQSSSPQSSFHRQSLARPNSFNTNSPQNSLNRPDISPQNSFRGHSISPQESLNRSTVSSENSFSGQCISPQGSTTRRDNLPRSSFY